MNPHPAAPGYAAIDFGTSNSAVALPAAGGGIRPRVELEPGWPTMPIADFYRADTPPQQPAVERPYGRAAIGACADGIEGRLMRSIKASSVRRCPRRAPTSAAAARCATAMSSSASCAD